MASAALPLTAKDLASDQEVRWCPGCGDFSVLAVMKQVLASLGVPREQFVFVSGVGCSSRLPYYLNTYGFQTLHGRAPTVATGLKLIAAGVERLGRHRRRRRPVHRRQPPHPRFAPQYRSQNSSFQQRSDGPDAGPVFADLARRHADARQPAGVDRRAAAAADAGRGGRGDVRGPHHRRGREPPDGDAAAGGGASGSAFVEIYQNCKVFNDGVFEYATDKGVKADNLVYLEHGKPLVFGQDQQPRRPPARPASRSGDADQRHDARADLLVHDERDPDTTLAHLLSRMVYPNCRNASAFCAAWSGRPTATCSTAQIEEAVRSRRRRPTRRIVRRRRRLGCQVASCEGLPQGLP